LYAQYRNAGDTGTTGYAAHNDLLQFWAEMGLPAAFLFLGIAVMMIWQTAQFLKNRPDSDEVRLSVLAPFFALAACFIHSLVTYNFNVISVLVLGGMCFGLWCRAIKNSVPLWTVPRVMIAGILCMAMITILCFQGSVIVARIARANPDYDAQRLWLNVADVLSLRLNPQIPIDQAKIYIRQSDLTKGAQLDAVQDNLLQADLLYQAADQLNPLLFEPPYERALLHGFVRNLNVNSADFPSQDPVELFEEALRRNPLHAPTRFYLSVFYEQQARHDDAYRVLKEGRNWPYPDQDTKPYFLRTQSLARARGDEETYTIISERLERLRSQMIWQ
jgi:hypothetical protein